MSPGNYIRYYWAVLNRGFIIVWVYKHRADIKEQKQK